MRGTRLAIVVSCLRCGEMDLLSGDAELDDGSRPTECLTCGYTWIRVPSPEWMHLERQRVPRPPQQLGPSRPRQVVIVNVARLNAASIEARALNRAQRFHERGGAPPWDDLLEGNRIGLMGEDAVEYHLRSLGLQVRSIAEDWLTGGPDLGDLEVASPVRTPFGAAQLRWRVEVKTRRFYTAAIESERIDYDTRADVLIKAVAPRGSRSQMVRLLGWFPTAAINDVGRSAPLRPMETIEAWPSAH
jgi:hypothetical protein